MTVLDFRLRTRLIFGPGCAARAGEIAREYSPSKRVLLVTDPGIVKAGHADRVRRALESAGVFVAVHDEVRENPDTSDVTRCVTAAARERVDCLIALGGGSSMDTAKGCNFILTNGGQMRDYWNQANHGKPPRELLPLLPFIAMPTTSGTGSECQSYALIADATTHRKMACGDPKAAARAALLDPELTVSQPRAVTACTGLDALAHALESGVCLRRNPLSLLFSREALHLGLESFSRVLENPENLEARGQMQLAAAYAGVAIENSMLGAAHSAANPLTAEFKIVHGRAVAVMLPHVLRYNAGIAAGAAAYRALDVHERGADDLIKIWNGLLEHSGIAPRLEQHGVTRPELPRLAADAAKQWTAAFNPRPLTEADFLALYEQAF